MCGSMARLDLGATNFPFSVQSVGALDLGCLQASHVEIFFACEHCNHRLTFSLPPEKHNWLGGAVFGGKWLAVDHLA